MYDLMVIGSGPGGYEAAIYAGNMGKSVALFEKAEIGGTCLNTGCIPTKTMLKSAHLYHEAKTGAELGITAEKVAFDMKALAARRSAIVANLRSGVEGMLKRAKVEIIRKRQRSWRRARLRRAARLMKERIFLSLPAVNLLLHLFRVRTQQVLSIVPAFCSLILCLNRWL